MQIRHQELEIPEVDPFLNCKLERQQYGIVLTEVVDSFPDGFVLAIDNSWGTGKTTFVKMWRQLLINREYNTIYFNAWENDFDLSPLTAIVAELKTLVGKPTEKIFDDLTKKGSMVAKTMLPAFIKAATKRYFDSDEISTAMEGLAKASAEAFEVEIAEYQKRKASILGFRSKLEEFVSKSESDKPIVFIIDELDRCRPNYAVEVLEQLKHFFAVPGITFVLSIDKEHLAASVKGFYGSEGIDTDEYLRRFVDLEYSIPAPSAEAYCKYLFELHKLTEFFSSSERQMIPDLREDGKYFSRMAVMLCSNTTITLRQMEKIFGRVRIILSQFTYNNFVFPECLFLLVYWSVIKPTFYKALAAGRLHPQAICDEFAEVFTQNDEHSTNFLSFTEVRLLVLYANEFKLEETLMFNDPENGERKTHLVSKFPGKHKSNLIDVFSHVNQDFDKRHTRLSHLTKKVELLEPLVVS